MTNARKKKKKKRNINPRQNKGSNLLSMRSMIPVPGYQDGRGGEQKETQINKILCRPQTRFVMSLTTHVQRPAFVREG